MNKEQRIEFNKLIAEFMGGYDHGGSFNFGADNDKYNLPQWADYKELQYHSSWDWLMPVVEKIQDTPAIIFEYTFSLIPFCRIMYVPKNGAHKYFISPQSNEITGIEAVCDCILQFIQWYNSQTPTPET